MKNYLSKTITVRRVYWDLIFVLALISTVFQLIANDEEWFHYLLDNYRVNKEV